MVAAVIAIFLGFIQKFGAAIHTIPEGVFGGLSIILFGLITVSGARIWVENQVDFKDSRNMLVAGVPGKNLNHTICLNYSNLSYQFSHHWCCYANYIKMG